MPHRPPTPTRTFRRRRTAWPVVTLFTTLTLLLATGIGQSVSAATASPSTVGTASGSYRTGLTKAALASLTSLGDAHLWVGLTSTRDVGKSFDVQVELLNNGVPVASGLRRCVSSLSTDAAAATEVVVPWTPVTTTTLKPGDVLSLRVSARIGTSSDGTECLNTTGRPTYASGLRLYYGSTSNASSIAATITPDPSVNLYLGSTGGACGKLNLAPRTLAETAPTATAARCQVSAPLGLRQNSFAAVGVWKLAAQCACSNALIPDVRNNPPAPKPEPIKVSELPLPPVTTDPTAGSCTAALNPHGTGCISQSVGLLSGGFMPDNKEVIARVTFAGAPAAPDPASIYTGSQMIMIKVDGTKFSNGDPWKCLTCGIPAANEVGLNSQVSYFVPFPDSKRILDGSNIIDCGTNPQGRRLHAGPDPHLSDPFQRHPGRIRRRRKHPRGGTQPRRNPHWLRLPDLRGERGRRSELHRAAVLRPRADDRPAVDSTVRRDRCQPHAGPVHGRSAIAGRPE